MMADNLSQFKMHSGHHNYMVSEMIPLNRGSLVCLCACVILFLQHTCAHDYICSVCAW